jgi:hypothetical protein
MHEGKRHQDLSKDQLTLVRTSDTKRLGLSVCHLRVRLRPSDVVGCISNLSKTLLTLGAFRYLVCLNLLDAFYEYESINTKTESG